MFNIRFASSDILKLQIGDYDDIRNIAQANLSKYRPPLQGNPVHQLPSALDKSMDHLEVRVERDITTPAA